MESLNQAIFENVFTGSKPVKKKTELPTLLCGSCGNCELNYHNKPESNIDNGFCVKFFQNVDLNEKNVSCWTSKQNTYYEDLSKISPQEKKADLYKRNKRANNLNIEFNQLTIF
jgi:hypothetical protein